MTFTIEDPQLDEELMTAAAVMGRSVNDLVTAAVKEKLQRLHGAKPKKIDWDAVKKLQDEISKMPILDTRSADEIIGYNEFGHFD